MKNILSSLFVFLFVFSCTENQSKLSSNDTDSTIFGNLHHQSSGITFQNTLTENDSLNYFTYGYLYMGGGVSAGDINNDGLTDLFFTGNMVSNKLYLNKGGLKFEDISEKASIAGDNRWYTGVTMADVNNDGFLDIYCSVGGKFGPKENQLFINNKNGTFTEKAEEYGIADVGNSVQATFFDYDLDGDLDLYVANYPPTPFNAPNQYYALKKKFSKKKETDRLYRNDGEIYTDVTNESGVRSFGLSLSVTIGDVNQDGWPDIYVSNDFSTPDLFYINNQNGTFSEKLKDVTKNTSFYGMGVDIADFNNDGLIDILQVDMTAKDNRRAKANMASMNPDLFWSTVNSGFHYQYMQNSLQLNNGVVNDSLTDFSNVSRFAGVSSTDWSWGPLFADLDNDGWKDIYISNGTRREINNRDFFLDIERNKIPKDSLLDKSLAIPSEKIDNFVFKNNSDLTFSQKNKEWGIEFKGFSNGCVYVDLDNDGDLDIVTNNIDDYASVFENTSSEHSNFLSLKFNGSPLNRFGIGVKATLFSNGKSQFQELTLSRGFQSSVAPKFHFGLAKEEKADSIRILWPNGKTQLLTNIAANQFLTIEHKNAGRNLKGIPNRKNGLFTTITDTLLIPEHRHIENYHNDFAKEILLPYSTSMLGPNLSSGDLNGDGLEDIVIGGASKYSAQIFFQSNTGYIKKTIDVFKTDKEYEDLGVQIFDADNDGDNDIYIVSGGNEFPANSKMLQDRLYVNDGNGGFVKSTNALPKIISSGSRIKSYDYDNDGDLDLFVGGRLVPGNYPAPASSYILENKSMPDHPKFIDVTDSVAPSLKNTGLVTDALWTDFNQDGATDLIVIGEWMPITFLQNNRGRFENVTETYGLSESNGWWFSINEADFDMDGDLDFIIGNLGLNYKYKATEEKTFDIFFNDFDKNNTNDIVLSYFNGNEQYPLRGRECSSQQMPAIKKKFEDYASFSTATLVDVYTKKDLESSLHYKIKSFASIYLENDDGKFVVHQLPNEAQISNINKILIDDFDGDNNLDAIIAGNLHAAEVETPRNDASNGLFLKGDGTGRFEAVLGKNSGLHITGDVKDMVQTKFNGTKHLVVAKNNDFLQWVKINL
ncbi:MAG: VCBS repeat-containing protein [Flavobacteriaceae bacterium]